MTLSKLVFAGDFCCVLESKSILEGHNFCPHCEVCSYSFYFLLSLKNKLITKSIKTYLKHLHYTQCILIYHKMLR